MAAGGGSAAPLRGAAGARAAADRLVARLQRQLADADRRRLEAEEAIDTLVGDAEVGARIRCLLPALAALVAGRAPTWLQKLRRNFALHAAAPGARILVAKAAELRAAQQGPRLERAAVATGASDDVEDGDTVESSWAEVLATRGASGALETQDPRAGGGLPFHARVFHVAELEPRLLAQADALAAERAPRPGLGGQGGTGLQDLPDAQGQLHGATPEGLVPGGLGTFPICSDKEAIPAGPGLAPGMWHTSEPLAEAEAFVQGWAAGWRLAEGASESFGPERLEAAEQDDEVADLAHHSVEGASTCVSEEFVTASGLADSFGAEAMGAADPEEGQDVAAHFSKQAAAAHGPSADLAELFTCFEEMLGVGVSVSSASQADVQLIRHPSKLSGTACETAQLFDPIEEPESGEAEPEGKQAEAVHGAAVPKVRDLECARLERALEAQVLLFESLESERASPRRLDPQREAVRAALAALEHARRQGDS
ncbi:unnamed protein product [Prorocentrum cordatum]|uniref:Uncharacterized protein n=1 Tax=Prorocentrum cordatum TaxID=2364126 RepID=A0ABN9WR73_9DINO|nr:unnamed protein product [Polarella glacialis]